MSAAHSNSNLDDRNAADRSFVVPFRIDVAPDRDVVRVSPQGELDLTTVGSVREQVTELVAAGFSSVLMDLRGVTFVDSSALHLVVELDASSRSDGWRLAIVPGPPAVQRAFDIKGLVAQLPFLAAAELEIRRWRRF